MFHKVPRNNSTIVFVAIYLYTHGLNIKVRTPNFRHVTYHYLGSTLYLAGYITRPVPPRNTNSSYPSFSQPNMIDDVPIASNYRCLPKQCYYDVVATQNIIMTSLDHVNHSSGEDLCALRDISILDQLITNIGRTSKSNWSVSCLLLLSLK